MSSITLIHVEELEKNHGNIIHLMRPVTEDFDIELLIKSRLF